jgi:hypothetical protein
VYGYPGELAAPIAVAAARERESEFEEIRFVFREERLHRVFAHAAAST